MSGDPLVAVAAVLAAAGAGAAVLLWAVAQRRAWRRVRRLSRRLETAEGVLEASSAAYIAWSAEGAHVSPGVSALAGARIDDLPGLLTMLERDEAERLEQAVGALRRRGQAFTFTANVAGGRTLRFAGKRARDAHCDVLLVEDISAADAAQAEAARHHDAALEETHGLRAMLDALPLPVWRRDPSLAIVDINAGYAAALDTRREEVLAKGLELGSGEGEARVRQLAERAARQGDAQSESDHLVVGGARVRYEFHESPMAGGGTLGYALDTTLVEEARSALADHVAAHGQVLESLGVAIAIYGPDTRLKFFNTAYVRLWRHDSAWLAKEPTLGEELDRLREVRRLPEVVDFPDFREGQVRLFTSLMGQEETLVHLPDGRALRKTITPHPFGGLLFTYEDVTDRLDLEREYNTLIEVQRRTLDNLYEGVALIGADGRLKLSNPAYGRLWQFSQSEIEGEPHISELVEKSRAFFAADEPWETLRPRIIARITCREPRSGRLERSDGSVLDYAIVPLPDGMVLLSYIDVTDRFRVERALRERNDALVAADSLKTEFIANVSYELRTPLNSIIGFAEILKGGMFGSLDAKQGEYVDGILQAGGALLDLINDILDLATLEAGYMELEIAPFDVFAMLTNVHSLVRERARERDLALTLDCAPGIGALAADERRIKQVLFNLLSNAFKFTPEGGRVTLNARREADSVVLSVSDTGIGIAQDQQSRVMRKFERGGDRMVRKSGTGAGLGLSLVQSFVELHGGRVEVVSAPEAGTTVRCRLPTTVTPASQTPAAAGPG